MVGRTFSSSQGLGLMAAMGAVLIWGGVFTVKAALLSYLNPETIVFLQYILALPLLAILARLQGAPMQLPFRRGLAIMLSGTVGIALFQLLVNLGIAAAGSVVASVFSALLPPLCLVVDIVMTKQFPSGWKLMSILLSTIGILLVVGMQSSGPVSLIGCLFLLLSDFAWVFFCNFNQKLQKDAPLSGTTILFYQSLGAILVLFPLSLGTAFKELPTLFSPVVIGPMLFLTLVNAIVAYLLLNFALAHLDVMYCNIIFNFVPVVTIALEWVLYRNTISFAQCIGTALIVISVSLAERKKRPEP